MKNMNSHYNSLKALMLTIDDIISDLEKKRDDIENKAYDEDIGMYCIENEMYNELDEQIISLNCCADYIASAMGCLVEYTD